MQDLLSGQRTNSWFNSTLLAIVSVKKSHKVPAPNVLM